MADEYDRKIMPGFMQTGLAIWLGCAYKSVEMAKSPQQTLDKMVSEAKLLFSVPSDAGEGIENKAKAVAAVWMQEGATFMEQCKEAGRKFTDPSQGE